MQYITYNNVSLHNDIDAYFAYIIQGYTHVLHITLRGQKVYILIRADHFSGNKRTHFNRKDVKHLGRFSWIVIIKFIRVQV